MDSAVVRPLNLPNGRLRRKRGGCSPPPPKSPPETAWSCSLRSFGMTNFHRSRDISCAKVQCRVILKPTRLRPSRTPFSYLRSSAAAVPRAAALSTLPRLPHSNQLRCSIRHGRCHIASLGRRRPASRTAEDRFNTRQRPAALTGGTHTNRDA